MSISAGIDVGSGTVKVAVMRSSGGDESGTRPDLLSTYLERIRRRDVMAVTQASYDAALSLAGIEPSSVEYVATTGEGDNIPWHHGHFYGITTHARGALYLHPSARGAADVGALHTRAMRFNEQGRVLQYRMTSQCASGSGQFLENIARYLGVSIEDVGGLSLSADNPEKCSGICAVLAETDVINMVSRGITTPNILRGIHDSMAVRLAGLIKSAGVSGDVLVTGGLARDQGLIAALNDRLNALKAQATASSHELSIFAGAIGAALWGLYRQARIAGKHAHVRQ